MQDMKQMARQLGRNIRVARVMQGISQEKLAEKSGLHRTYIGMVERGEKNITLVNYGRIAGALGMNLYDLFSGIDAVFPRQKSSEPAS